MEGKTPSAGAVSDSQCGTHLVDVLEVEPGVKGPDGQIQVRQLQLRHPRADVPFVGVDAEGGEAQTVLVQHALLHGDGVVLVKDHREGVRLDLVLWRWTDRMKDFYHYKCSSIIGFTSVPHEAWKFSDDQIIQPHLYDFTVCVYQECV